METLVIVIIILVAVLSTPLSLKKLIDHANRRKQLEMNAKPDELANAKSAEPSGDSPESRPSNQWDDWEDPWND